MSGAKLYRMEKVTPGGEGLVDLDYLIVALGTDTRGLDVLAAYANSTVRVGTVILLEFEDRLSSLTPRELEGERARFDAFGHHIVEVRASLDDPSGCGERMKEAGVGRGGVGLDMTLLTRPFLFWLLKYLSLVGGRQILPVYYTEPESYRYRSGTYDSYRAAEGPLEVREVPGFPGAPRSAEGSTLAVLLGFDGQLATAINEDVAPRQTIVVNGFPSYYQKYKDISLVNNERLVAGAKLLYSPADNPFETYNTLKDVLDASDDVFITIAPLGTKPMALGAGLFAIDYPQVRLVYPQPRGYVPQTTRNSWQSWRYDIVLGR